MSDNSLWFGFLEAGDKSTAVIIDHGLNTGKPDTVYIFNQSRGKILEYNRSIVEPKLRELSSQDADTKAELKNAYLQVRAGFEPRASRVLDIPERGARTTEAEQPKENDSKEELDLVSVGSDDEIEDDTWSDDEN